MASLVNSLAAVTGIGKASLTKSMREPVSIASPLVQLGGFRPDQLKVCKYLAQHLN
jgi:hypothetical protein